jgi:hypothetical protein
MTNILYGKIFHCLVNKCHSRLYSIFVHQLLILCLCFSVYLFLERDLTDLKSTCKCNNYLFSFIDYYTMNWKHCGMIIQKHMFVGVEKKEYTEMNVYTLKDDNTKLFLFWKKEGKMKKRTAVYRTILDFRCLQHINCCHRHLCSDSYTMHIMWIVFVIKFVSTRNQ